MNLVSRLQAWCWFSPNQDSQKRQLDCFYVRCAVHSEPSTRLISSKMPLHLTIEGKCEHLQEELFFWWKKTKVGGILHLGRSTVMLFFFKKWNGVNGWFFFEWLLFLCSSTRVHSVSCSKPSNYMTVGGKKGFSCCLIPPFFTCSTFTNIHNPPHVQPFIMII